MSIFYVVHFCKNSKCNNCWIDEDLTNAQSRPPKWKYCRECCKKMGIDFDSQIRPKRKLSQKQLETINKYKFQKRKKSSEMKDLPLGDIQGGKNES